jgi:hypothetical protein
MVTPEDLELRRELIGSSPELGELLRRLEARAAPLLERRIVVPEIKAGLSTRGGVCPSCGGALGFDPWSPDRHVCSRCGTAATGDLHRGSWARAQHLWVAERIAHLAAVGVLAESQAAAAKAKDLLTAYGTIYPALPNRDNVLGPSHLFFSTYLESIWILSYLAGAVLLRERGWLDAAAPETVNGIADEAAALIGEFNEGMSNRQTWNSAALTAIGVWFGDEELIRSSVEERTGLVGHLTDGFGADGMWLEGENYHLFALRGLLLGIQWARAGGAELLSDPALARHLGQALMAPAASALPDLTFPARKDSRFGVPLGHPAYLECWETGLTWLDREAPAQLTGWLRTLYAAPSRPAAVYDAYLHDAGLPPRERTERFDLSWWMLLAMTPALDPEAAAYRPESVLLQDQGLAVLRRDDRYVSLECGDRGGGHGHPDRLHLTLHAGGVHWLPDPGTGSYVDRSLFWYRSTLAHNAPLEDGESQVGGSSRCAAFADQGDHAWVAGEWKGHRRSIVTGPGWLVDLLEPAAGPVRRIELPWHFQGEIAVETPGRWTEDTLADEFVSAVERFVPERAGPIAARVTAPSGAALRVHLTGGTLLRATGPGLPTAPAPLTFLVARSENPVGWLGLVIDFDGTVDSVAMERGEVTLATRGGPVRVGIEKDQARIETGAGTVTLGGARPRPPAARPLMSQPPIPNEATAYRVDEPPALDGSFDGFVLEAPVELADEMFYLRSEEPYGGAEELAAVAYVNWDERALYLGVEVSKPDVIVRGADAPPLELDNEPDDIHSDGVQVYLRLPGGEERGLLVRPAEGGGIVARPIPGEEPDAIEVAGGSEIGDGGYRLTFALPYPELASVHKPTRADFELIVNEMRPDRVRRAGQLVFGGGGGWVYLRGDRHDPDRWGALDLVP